MKKEVIQKFLITCFIMFLCIFSIGWFFRDPDGSGFIPEENRKIARFPVYPVDEVKKILDLSSSEASGLEKIIEVGNLHLVFNTAFEKSISDRFPARIPLVKFTRWVDRALIQITGLITNDTALPTDLDSNKYVFRDKSRLFPPPRDLTTARKTGIEERIRNYQELIRTYPEINFMVFYIQLIQDSPFHPLNKYFPKSDKGMGVNYFEERIPSGLQFSKMTFSNYSEYDKYFYRTDHHWNVRGACYGYEKIYQMIKIDFPDISPMNYCDFIEIKGLNFLGTYARESLFPVKPDIFELIKVSLPPHSIFINGIEEMNDLQEDYFSGNFDHQKYANHYGIAFGSWKDSVEYYFPSNSERNLLIIGSSYRKPIELLLASHYQHTYTIDLRAEKNFSMSSFLVDHKVDDVLIMGENLVVYEESEWLIKP